MENTDLLTGKRISLPAPGTAIHFVGILGSSMSALAEYAYTRGYTVTGSDRAPTEVLSHLSRLGIYVTIGHRAENVRCAKLVVASLAVPEENPELVYARANGIPVVSRADLLGTFFSSFPERIAVSGSHGKSSVTAMLERVFSFAYRNPTVFSGALLSQKSPFRPGGGKCVIAEACEYRGSFLSLSPTLGVILNVDYDHPDAYPTMESYRAAFSAFAARCGRVLIPYDSALRKEKTETTLPAQQGKTTPRVSENPSFSDKKCSASTDSPGAAALSALISSATCPSPSADSGVPPSVSPSGTHCAATVAASGKAERAFAGGKKPTTFGQMPSRSAPEDRRIFTCGTSPDADETKRVFTYGTSPDADFFYTVTGSDHGYPTFFYRSYAGTARSVRLSVPGTHMAANATAALAVAELSGIDPEIAAVALENFRGIPRRLENIGTYAARQVYYDYAHHPCEIKAGIETVRALCGGRVSVVFCPHTYSRTAALFDGFVATLSLADDLFVLPIFAAREAPLPGVSSEALAAAVGKGARALSPEEVPQALRQTTGTVILMGAGNLDAVRHLLFPDVSKKG